MSILPFMKPNFTLRFTRRKPECAGCQIEYDKIDTDFFTVIRINLDKGETVEPLLCDKCVHHNIRLEESRSSEWRTAVGRRVQRNPSRYLL